MAAASTERSIAMVVSRKRRGYTAPMNHVGRSLVLAILAATVSSCLVLPPSGGSTGADAGTAAAAVAEQAPGTGGAVQSMPARPGETDEAQSAAVAGKFPSRVLAAGTQSAVRTPVMLTVTSEAVFEEVWYAIHANQLSPPPVPVVDFARETVIVLILGERPSAGYGVRISAIARASRGIEVTVDVVSPGSDRMAAAVLTSPFQLTAVEVTDTPVSFAGDDVREGFDAE